MLVLVPSEGQEVEARLVTRFSLAVKMLQRLQLFSVRLVLFIQPQTHKPTLAAVDFGGCEFLQKAIS